MLLMAVDIGNTNVVIGFIDDGRIAGTYRITTKANHTSDEYGLMITQFLALSGYKPADVDDVIISSVVPKVMHSFRASIVKFLDIDPMIVGPGIKTGLNIRMDNPQNMGADCIADCAGAYYEYGGDFRTDHHRYPHRRGRTVGRDGAAAGSGDHPSEVDSRQIDETGHAGGPVLQLPRRHRTHDRAVP